MALYIFTRGMKLPERYERLVLGAWRRPCLQQGDHRIIIDASSPAASQMSSTQPTVQAAVSFAVRQLYAISVYEIRIRCKCSPLRSCSGHAAID